MKLRTSTLRSVLTASIAALLSSAGASRAAVIVWSGPATIVDATDVLTAGTLGYAYNLSNTLAASATVNGVAFTGSTSTTTLGGNVSIAGVNANNTTAFGSAAGSPYGALPAAYKNLLKGGDYANGATTVTLTLNNLIAGHSYAAQIWVNDNRSLGGADRKETVTGGGGNTVTLDYNSTNADGGVGQHTTGLFTASATTQAFSLLGNASTQFSSIQLRDVTNLGYWVGTAGATWDASTTANFAGNLFSAALATTDFATAKAPLKSVTFADSYWSSGVQTAVTQTAINVAAGGVSTGRVSFHNTALNYTVTSPDANGIAGATIVSKEGTGSLTLLGAHSYTGGTFVGGGTLFVGNGTTDGVITGNVSVSAGANVTVNNAASGTFTGAISGAGSLTKLNVNTLILAGDTSHTGTTTIGAGTLELAGTGGPLGAIVNNGTLVLNRSGATSIAGPISGTGAFIQAGAGTTALSAASNFSGTTNITGGTLRPAVAAGSTLWLDAAKTSSLSTSGSSVTQWSDAAGGVNFASQGATASQPALVVDNAFTGPSKTMVDFGVDGSSGQWMQFSNNLADIRSVFWVMKGSGFLLGSTSTYDFHRNDPLASPTAPIWWGPPENYAHANIRNGQTYLDGTLVDGTTTGLSGGYQMIDVITTGNVQANALANDRNIPGRIGGQQIGEVIIFNTALNTADRQRVEAYLNYKWFGLGAGVGDLLPVTTPVTLSGGGTLDLSGVNYQTVASLSSSDPASRVTLGSAAFTAGDANDTTFDGVISEGGSFTKTGAGKLTLTNTNTHTGVTTIAGGTLELGGTAGTPGAGAVVNHGTLRLNRSNALSLPNAIGGTGALIQAGAGTATLSGANTYTGATLVSGGALQLDGAAAAGALTTSGLTINGGAAFGFTTGAASALGLTGKPLSLGGTIAFDLGAAGVNDTIAAGSFTLTANSAFTFNAIGAIGSGTTYTLLTSASPIATGGFTISGQTLGRLTLTPAINANTITLTPILVQGIWSTTGGGNWSTGNPAATGGNWTNYKPTVTGDAALFGGTITGAATVNVDTPHRAGFITFANANSYTIGNAGGGNLTLDNSPSNAVIAVTAGAHTIAENVALASSVVVGPSAGTALTISGDLSGAGGVQLSGAGTLTLGGTNTHSGGVTLSGGTLNLASASALGAAGGVFTLNGGTFDNTTGGAMTVANNHPQSWGGSFTFTGSNSVDLGTDVVTLTAPSTVNVSASTLRVGGAIDGAFGFAKSGAGTLTLSGASTFTGGVTLNAGTLNLDHASALGAGGAFTINGGTIDNTSGAAIISGGNPLVINGDFTFTGSSDLAIGGGAGSLGTAPGTSRVAVVNAGTLTLGGSLASGTTADTLVKAGSGTLVLSGANSHGVTLVAEGILQAGSDSALGANSAAVIVSSGASLDLNGRTLQGYTQDISIGGAGANPTLGALGNSGATNLFAIRGIVLTADASIGGDGGRWDIGRLDFNANPDVTVNHIEGEGFTLTKVGANYLGLLTGANNLAGFVINGGTVAPHENTSFGAGPVTLNAGIIQPWAGLNLANAFTLNGGTLQTDGFNDSYNGPIAINGPVTVNATNGIITFNGNVSGSGPLAKTGGNNLVLAGGNTQTGTLTVSSGNVLFASTTGHATDGGVIMDSPGSFLIMQAADQFGPNASVSFNASLGYKEFALYGHDQTIAALSSENEFAVVQNSHGALGAAGASATLTIDQAADTIYSGYLRDNTGNDAFLLSLTKDGAGALTLTGPNLSYTGLTTIEEGTLNVNGPLGNGANIVNANGGETNFGVSQTLGELNIGPGAVVALSAAPPAPFAGGEGFEAGAVDAVPEPGSASLLLLGTLGLLARRRRTPVTV